MNLIPCPRHLKRRRGFFILPTSAEMIVCGDVASEDIQAIGKRLASFSVKTKHSSAASNDLKDGAPIQAHQHDSAPDHIEGYTLTITPQRIEITFREIGGLRASVATLRQMLREYGRKLPCLEIRDWPDFPKRGVMLDISRGRVPRLETLFELVNHLADFKINEFQLYTEHTFAYRKYRAIWQRWGALTAAEIRKLDLRCRDLGIDLVPNQNSFGHLREFLAYPSLKPLAEVAEPYESDHGSFLRYPSTLAPNHPGTIPFLRDLYDELLPNFSSTKFNVGCDETWDLGRGQSKALCKRDGKGRVYLNFLKRIQREVSSRGKQMMFWGDIVLNHPELIKELPKDAIALNWGYEANHPFDREASLFAKARIPFYVCPGSSTWMTLIGRHDNALPNLRAAAKAGRRNGARGYLITDWGDGGHPQPLAVSFLPYAAGAALSWCAQTFDEQKLIPVLSRDIFHDATQRIARAANELGSAHRKLGYLEANATPLGAVIAAPPAGKRELFCRNGLKYYARIAPHRIKAALREIQKQQKLLTRSVEPMARNRRAATTQHQDASGHTLLLELSLAARMAAQSCRFMLWQQAVAVGNKSAAKKLALLGIRELRQLEKDFVAYWPTRNKGPMEKCAAFLRWRMADYRQGTLPFPAETRR